MLPERLVPALTDARLALRLEHARARVTGGGYYPLPEAMVDKLPNALSDWRWGWVFPARHDVYDRQRGRRVRPPVHITTIQRAIAMAGVAAGINRRVADHTFRHSFATQLLRSGYDIRTVQELLGHADVTTTIVYLHVLDRGPGVRSPFDQLPSSTTPAMPPAPTGTHCDYPQFPRCDKPGRPILPQCATTVATRACRRLAALLQAGICCIGRAG